MYIYMHVFICHINVHVFVVAVMLASLYMCVCAYAVHMMVVRPTCFACVIGISELMSCEVFQVCAWIITEEHRSRYLEDPRLSTVYSIFVGHLIAHAL